jgi:hypothetical protein
MVKVVNFGGQRLLTPTLGPAIILSVPHPKLILHFKDELRVGHGYQTFEKEPSHGKYGSTLSRGFREPRMN